MPGFDSQTASVAAGLQHVVFTDNASFDGTERGGTLQTDGQLWIGSTAVNVGNTHINVGTITSTGGTIAVTYNSPDINIEAVGGGVSVDSFAMQTGISPVVPTGAGLVTFNGSSVAAGTNPVRTNGTGANTMQLEVQTAPAIAATDATRIGLAAFDSAAFDVDANGFVQLNGGGIATTAFDVQANTAPGTDPVVPTAAGVVTVNGAAVAAHAVPIETRSRAANAYNIEVQYSSAVAGTDATRSGIAHFDSTDFTVDANGFVALAGAGAGQTITGDAGGALAPTGGNWNILGRSGSKTSGAGSTLTVNSPPFSQVGGSGTSVLNSGEFVTATATRTLPATAGLLDGDLVIYAATSANILTITANTAQTIRLGSAVTAAAGTCVSTAIGDSISLRFNATAVQWQAVSSIGIWVLT